MTRRYYGSDMPRSTGPHPDPLSGVEPCTDEALAQGCTCRLDGHPSDPDTSVRRDRDCPLHGEDPDYALEAMRDGAVHLRNIDTMESDR